MDKHSLRRREDLGCNFTRYITALTAPPSVHRLWRHEICEKPLQRPRRNWDPEDGSEATHSLRRLHDASGYA